MTPIYCVKCKSKTENKDEKKKMTKNGTPYMSAVCFDCNSKKNQFVSKKYAQGKGFATAWNFPVTTALYLAKKDNLF